MELALTSGTYLHRQHLPSTVNHYRRRPSSFIKFPKSSSSSSPSLTRITTFSSNHNYPTPKHQLPKFTNPTPQSVLKTAFITGVTVAAVFLSRFTVKPAVAAPIFPPPPPATVESVELDSELQAEEKTLEEHLSSHPEDIKALKTLMEVKIKIGKVHEAIGILNQMIDLEPEDSEWQLLKYHLHSYAGDHEFAKLGFQEIITKDPLRVEAYHGLVMAASAKESPTEIKEVENRVLEGIEICKKQKKKDDIRDFKLLLAQIRVIQSDYNDAVKIYQELSKEEPRDFRPYLCQGIIYTLLGKNDDAEKNFEKYRRLVPKGHPYARYFDDNMVATKVFAQKVENERAYSKS